MAELQPPPAEAARWEVRRRDAEHSVVGVFVEAQTAFQAWHEALPDLPGSPGFAECECKLLEAE